MRGRVPVMLALAAQLAVARRAPAESAASAGPVVAWTVVMPGFEMPLALSRTPPWVALAVARRVAAPVEAVAVQMRVAQEAE